MLLLGAVSPWAIRLASPTLERAGEVAGRLYAVSTLGSLVGDFVTALVMIPLDRARSAPSSSSRAVLALVAAVGLRSPRGAARPRRAGSPLLALPAGITKADAEAASG